MPTESFREKNRRRRQQNAFEHLREYASAKGLPDPDAAAREAVEGLHGTEQVASRAAPAAATEKRKVARAAAVTEAAPEAPAAKAEKPAEGPTAAAGEAAGGAASVAHRLEDRTKEQLYARAQELEIEGRSSMTKDELIAAIRARQ